MKSPLDALDRRLVELLQANGRASMQELSTETGLSRSAVFTRVRRLEHDGIITGYAAQTIGVRSAFKSVPFAMFS